MERYHLIKLVQWAGELHNRKRMQKVTYLLQSAGCAPLDVEFLLHVHGPYASELAHLTDEMVQAGLLAERATPNGVGQQYSYSLTDRAVGLVNDFEGRKRGCEMLDAMAPFEELAKQLMVAAVNDLEVGSAIVFFQRHGSSWGESVEHAARLKHIDPQGELIARGKVFASRVFRDRAGSERTVSSKDHTQRSPVAGQTAR